MQSQSRMYIGAPGEGKSNLISQNVLDLARQREFSVFVFDLPGTMADSLVCQLSAKGMESRTEYEELQQVESVIQFPMFFEPTGTSQLQRESEFRSACQDFLMPFLARRGEPSAEMKPLIREWSLNTSRVTFSLPERPTLNYMTRLFDRDSVIARWMLRNARDQQAVREFQILLQIAERSPAKWTDAVQPARRLLEPIEDPRLWGREGEGELERLILEKKIVLENLSKVSDETARAHTIFKTNAIIRTCVNYFQRTGKPLPCIIVLEEAGYLRTCTPAVLNALRALRKVGVFFWVCSQSPLDFSEGKDLSIFNSLKDLIPTRVYFRLGSGAENAAEDFMTVLFDSKEVLDYRKKTVHDGWDEIKSITHTVTKDEHGHHKKTSSESTRERARYREEQDAIYKTPQQKLGELTRLLSELKTGQVMIRSHAAGTQQPISTPLLGEPWPSSTTYVKKWQMTLEEKRLREIIQRIRTRPLYRAAEMTPESSMRPGNPPPPAAAPVPNPVPPVLPTATARLANRGTP